MLTGGDEHVVAKSAPSLSILASVPFLLLAVPLRSIGSHCASFGLPLLVQPSFLHGALEGAHPLQSCGKGAYLRALRVQLTMQSADRKAEIRDAGGPPGPAPRHLAAARPAGLQGKKSSPAGCPAGERLKEGIQEVGYSSGKRLDRRRMKVGMSRSDSI